jgi:hypothetical protein
LAWKLFLGVLGPNRETWVKDTMESRREFKSLAVVHKLYNTEEVNPENGDPLSTDENCQDDAWKNKFM